MKHTIIFFTTMSFSLFLLRRITLGDIYSKYNYLPILFLLTPLFFPTIANASPSDISGLALWLDASDVDGDGNAGNEPANGALLNMWNDKSGNNNHATVFSGQSAGQYNTTSSINNKPVVSFTHTNSSNGSVYITPMDIRSSTMEDVTIFTVYRETGSIDVLQGIWGNDNAGWDRFFLSTYPTGNNGVVSKGLASGGHTVIGAGLVNTVRLMTAVYDGNNATAGSSAIYFDGQVSTTFVDTTHATDAQNNFFIGWDGNDNPFNGDIAEVILYNRAITDCEMSEINQYLGVKYGQDFGGIAPGNVNNNCSLQLWLKADAGINQTDSQTLTNWSDQSSNEYIATNGGSDGQTSPTFRNNTTDNINFNPVVEFDGIANGIDLADNYIFSNNDGMTFFAVVKPDIKVNQNNFIFDFGQVGNSGYGFTYANDEFQIYTPYDYGGVKTGGLPHSYNINSVIYTGKIDFINEQRVYLNGTSVHNNVITLAKITANEIDEGSAHSGCASGPGPVTIGRQSKVLCGNERLFDGKIAEIILYDVDLLDSDRDQVQSYLAIKYGITLDSTINYINSSSTVIYPSTTTHSGYTNDIVGIGIDSGSNLNQPKSRSVNSDSIITITDSGNSNGNFLLLGNDDGILTFSSTEVPNIGNRLVREWKVAETGELGMVTINFDLTNVAGADFTNASKYMLLLDSDGDFTDATITTGATITGNTVEFSNINLTDGQYISLAYNNVPSTGFDTMLEFDGTNDYIDVGSGINLVNQSFTMEAWAKRSSSGSKDFIISQGNAGTNQALHFGFRDNNKFTCSFYGNDLDTTATYTDSDWHHWACSYDAATNERIIYQDGAIVAQATASGAFQGSGSLYIGNYSPTSDYYHGSLDEVRIWDTACTQTEIHTSYTTTLIGNETNLIGYWKFEEGSGITTNDISSNSNNGTLTNMADIDWVKFIDFKMAENSSLTDFLIGFDADNDSLIYSLVDDNAGAVVLNNASTGKFTYTATTGGTYTFSYKVYDGLNYSDVETVTVIVAKPNPVVDNLGDENDADTNSGQNTLQEAIFYASDGDTITFDPSITGQTIYLNDQIFVGNNITIDGTGQNITLSGDSGNDGTRDVGIFYIPNNIDVTINNLTFTKSNIKSTYDGVIHNRGDLVVNNSIFSDNTGGGAAAAIHNHYGNLEVNNCYFLNNIFSGMAASINNLASPVVINNSIFDSNSAGSGSVIYSAWGNVTLNNITAFNNSGNAIFLQDSATLNINNSTIVNNIHEAFKFTYSGSAATIKNTTISGNNKGIVNAGTLNLLNTIVANSTIADCENTGTITTNINNLIEDGSCSPTFSGDPFLGSLADNGGDTQTMALQSGSSAIATGDSATCLATDQRGESRPTNCDLGAYEYESIAPIAGFSTALDFDGVDDYISANLVTTATDNITMEAWIKLTGSTGNKYIFNNGNANSSGYGLKLNSSYKLDMICGGVAIESSNKILPANEWHHVALVRNSGTWEFYFDGIAFALTGNPTPNIPNGIMTIGSNNTGSSNFQGLIDEMRVWNVARSQAQIQANMYTSLQGNETNLVGYWQFSEGSGTAAMDSSGNGNNGTLNNMDAADWITSDIPVEWTINENDQLNNRLPAYDPDGDDLTYSLVDNSGGAVVITDASTGEFTFTSNSVGIHTFTYKVNDGTADSDIATATVNIAGLIVDNIADIDDGDYTAGQNTLREAIANISSGDIIVFDPSIAGQTIVLSEQLTIDKDLIIDGTGQNITISGNNAVRVFEVTAGYVTFRALHIKEGNAGSGSGGGIKASGGTVIVDKSTFTANDAADGGGLLAGNNTVVNITNSTFQGNSATGEILSTGGGIHAFSGTTLNIKNTTIAGNTANKAGAGLRIENANGVSIYNTLIANNDNTSADQDDCHIETGSLTANVNNLIKIGSNGCITTLITDPNLSILADNGSDTQTMALLSGSPAINAGDNATCETTDQRGETRPKHTTCDIGAYEYELPAPSDLTANSLETQINLSWTDNSSDETGFKVERDGSLITTTITNSYNDPSLTCETAYNYSVMATNPSVDSVPISINATTSICPPTDLSATATSDTQINLKWTDNSSSETGFKVMRSGSLITTTSVNATSYSDTNLECNKTYTYSLMATSVTDSSDITIQAATLPCPIDVYYDLTIIKNGNGTVAGSGINCGNECVRLFADQTEVVLISTPDDGWLFDSWTGDCDGNVIINSAKTCTANFVEEEVGEHKLTINIIGLGTITDGKNIDCPDSCEASFLDQEIVPLTIKPKIEWVLKNWSCDEQVYMDDDKICDAIFIKDPNIPNNGDGNGDGIHDADQPNIVSMPDQSSGNYLTLDISKNVTVTEIYTDLAENQGYFEEKYIFPQGLVYF